MPAPEALPNIFQRGPHDCATAAWRCVHKYQQGMTKRILDLSNPVSGTDPSTLVAVIRHSSQWEVLSGSMMLSDLRHLCDTLRPVICLVTFPNAKDSHYIVVGGVWRGRVYFHCPEDSWQSMRDDDFLNIWHGLGEFSHFHHYGIAAYPRPVV